MINFLKKNIQFLKSTKKTVARKIYRIKKKLLTTLSKTNTYYPKRVIKKSCKTKHYNFTCAGEKINGWNMTLLEMHPI